MTVTTTGRAAYRGGVSHTGYLAGFETANKLTRVLRYTFTTPADGVSKLSFTAAHLAHSASYSWGGLNWYATTSPTSHVNAGAGSASHGTLTITGNGKDYDISAAEAAVNLPANTEAYIYIFPNNANYFLWNFANVASLNITTAAGSSTIAAITQTVETLGTLTVSLNKAVDAFRHKLTVAAGGKTLYTSELFDISYSVTVPRAWFDSFPSATTISATATVTTYNGDTAVGTASAAVTITADDGMRPQISEGWATAAPYNIGAAAGLTGYIAGYSQAEISFDTAKLSQAAGAVLASVTVTCSGVTSTAAPYRTPILLGAADVVCTAADSRGRTATQTIRIEPMAYAPPTLSQVQILRCTAAGVEAEDGNHYSAKATAIFSALGGQNTLTLTAAHKIQGGVYGTETALTSGEAAIIGTISPDSTYQVRITATDALGNTTVAVTSLPTRQWALKFRVDGQGAAFGKAAETDKALEIPADWAFKIGSSALTAELLASLTADIMHPVGMYVWLAAETDPATLWGGTWVRQAEGMTLVSAGDNYPLNSTGGEATHALTIGEMPSHQHQLVNGNSAGYDYSGWTKGSVVLHDAGATGWAGNANTSFVGGSAAHNNMMPYKAAYCWLRTA
nr:MAG TPA: Baseplate structural protein [Caudoviricetes sp.]